MIVLRCTQRLLKASGIKPVEEPPAPTAPLCEWYANIVPLPFRGRSLVVFVHDRTLLSVVAPGRVLGTTVPTFQQRLPCLLQRLNLPQAWIDEHKEGGGKRFVITDAGMNDLLRPSHYAGYHAVEPVESQGREHQRVDVVGPICETGDFLALDRDVEGVETGELLVLRTTGAYGFSMSSTYNQRPRPAEVLVDGAEVSLVRRRETLEDLVAAELDL